MIAAGMGGGHLRGALVRRLRYVRTTMTNRNVRDKTLDVRPRDRGVSSRRAMRAEPTHREERHDRDQREQARQTPRHAGTASYRQSLHHPMLPSTERAI